MVQVTELQVSLSFTISTKPMASGPGSTSDGLAPRRHQLQRVRVRPSWLWDEDGDSLFEVPYNMRYFRVRPSWSWDEYSDFLFEEASDMVLSFTLGERIHKAHQDEITHEAEQQRQVPLRMLAEMPHEAEDLHHEPPLVAAEITHEAEDQRHDPPLVTGEITHQAEDQRQEPPRMLVEITHQDQRHVLTHMPAEITRETRHQQHEPQRSEAQKSIKGIYTGEGNNGVGRSMVMRLKRPKPLTRASQMSANIMMVYR